MNLGPILVQTLRHFFPELNDWLDDVPDPRFQPFVVYHKRFLLWWGLSLFLFQLGSRRQLDYQLNTDGPEVLDNLNRLAGTDQETRPVNKTLNVYLGRIGTAPIIRLLRLFLQRLLRMKALAGARLQGRYVIAVDGTGYLLFRTPHCEHCLTQTHGDTTRYMHQALEAKLLGPAQTVLSIGTTFIDNRDLEQTPAAANAEERKQDCELKALSRLLPHVRQDFPQLRLCVSGDGLYACGRAFQLARAHDMAFVFVFKPGRLPAVWADFQALLTLQPEQYVQVETPDGVRQVYRWVEQLSYVDSEGRPWTFTALQCEEQPVDGPATLWAWVTDLEVNRDTVVEVATKGGRHRWHLENQGFNAQKNSGLNLEHAYSHEQWEAYYFLLQIAHVILQLVEKGSLLRQLAILSGRTPLQLFGSLKNMAERLRESVRFLHWPETVYDATAAARIQIRLDSS